MAIAGHISQRMLEPVQSSADGSEAKAMETLAVSTKSAGYDKNGNRRALALKNMVGPNGFEPSTSSVSIPLAS
jgi:hypothetical protein